MNLIEVYLQEVERRLPERNREDILLEIRSTIEDMLPDGYTEEDVKEVLKKMGNPILLAGGYRDRPMHLIGPRYYDMYISLIKMILPIAAVISLISLVSEFFLTPAEGNSFIDIILTFIGKGVSRIIEVGIQVFFWMTLTFSVIERVDKENDQQPLTSDGKKWTPDQLKKVSYVPKKRAISLAEVFGTLLWTAIWATVYFNAGRLLGIYENQGNGLTFVAPSLNQDVLNSFWPPIIIVIGLEIGLALFKMVQRQWTKQLAWYNLIQEVMGALVFVFIITTSGLFNPEFVSYTADLFNVTAEQVQTRVIWGSSAIFIFFAALNSFDGFRKYKRGTKKV
ncbi:hypothetical protein [Halobacillus sp. Marseille-Q1614]|uniref:HAAS signaling domain-containing protein n=1 Tax=Halobacillus sp. Marseille-Q1614 TaxID=2709134 RepID=UPI00156E2389|nr:hypothetical protein [Halobacillus sp. Marseille-Q1614]